MEQIDKALCAGRRTHLSHTARNGDDLRTGDTARNILQTAATLDPGVLYLFPDKLYLFLNRALYPYHVTEPRFPSYR